MMVDHTYWQMTHLVICHLFCPFLAICRNVIVIIKEWRWIVYNHMEKYSGLLIGFVSDDFGWQNGLTWTCVCKMVCSPKVTSIGTEHPRLTWLLRFGPECSHLPQISTNRPATKMSGFARFDSAVVPNAIRCAWSPFCLFATSLVSNNDKSPYEDTNDGWTEAMAYHPFQCQAIIKK